MRGCLAAGFRQEVTSPGAYGLGLDERPAYEVFVDVRPLGFAGDKPHLVAERDSFGPFDNGYGRQ